ncbi:MAG TPA: VOC family protein [Steroidobacteraceae bacterium]
MSNAELRGRFVWHELMTPDPSAAQTFYSKVLPWKSQPSGMPDYTLWMAGTVQRGGMMAMPASSAGAPPHWITYIGTPNVDAAVAEVERLGGKVLKSAADIPNVGRFAVVADPQGAGFALYTPASAGDGNSASDTDVGGFAWHELYTTDLAAAVSFYTQLFGWEKGPTHDMGEMGPYQLILNGGKQVAGVFKPPHSEAPPNWGIYVEVADAAKAAKAAKAAGGRVLNGPMEVPGGGWMAQIMDPQGGVFAVHEQAKKAAAQPAQAPAAKSKSPPKPKSAAAAPAEAQLAAAPKKAPAKAAAKAAKKSAPVKTAAKAKKAARKIVKKAAKKAAGRPAAKKAKKAGKKVAKKAMKKAAAPRAAAKRGKSARRKK